MPGPRSRLEQIAVLAGRHQVAAGPARPQRETKVYDQQPHVPNSPEGYAAWRSKIPWDDAEIAACLSQREEGAAPWRRPYHLKRREWFERTKRLTRSILSDVLPYLVRVCSICGERALYRFGNAGRCRTHRDLRPDYSVARSERFDKAAGIWAVEHAVGDRKVKADAQRRSVAKRHK